jgi:hypothetical protein
MKISIPKLSLVVLIGPSGSGRSTFARRLFLPTEVLSPDACRGMVSDDANNQAVTNEAFEVLQLRRRPAPRLGAAAVLMLSHYLKSMVRFRKDHSKGMLGGVPVWCRKGDPPPKEKKEDKDKLDSLSGW